nr:hypothetical protein CFP56_10024 [Quercus suber]
MSDQPPKDNVGSSPPATPVTEEESCFTLALRLACAATGTACREQSVPPLEVTTPTHLRVSSLIAYKQAALRYGTEDRDNVGLLRGILYLVTEEEYIATLKVRLFNSSPESSGTSSPASYSTSRAPWVLMHPNHGRCWIHEGWLIYDFANAGLTIGQDFIAITSSHASYDATERLSPIGQYSLNGTFEPFKDHASNTIVALPIFKTSIAGDLRDAARDNTLALAHYNPLRGKRLRKVPNFKLPLVPEYPPRPVSSQTMRYIEFIRNALGYLGTNSNACVPNRSWLRQVPFLQPIIHPTTGTLKTDSQLYGLRGNHAVFRGRAWDKLCFANEKDRQDPAFPNYWQDVFEERCFSTSAMNLVEEAVTEGLRTILKRDSVTDVPPGYQQGFVEPECWHDNDT